MQLSDRIDRLNVAYEKALKISNEPEMLSDYEFSLNDMANIELEIIELQSAIKILSEK